MLDVRLDVLQPGVRRPVRASELLGMLSVGRLSDRNERGIMRRRRAKLRGVRRWLDLLGRWRRVRGDVDLQRGDVPDRLLRRNDLSALDLHDVWHGGTNLQRVCDDLHGLVRRDRPVRLWWWWRMCHWPAVRRWLVRMRPCHLCRLLRWVHLPPRHAEVEVRA